MRAAGEDDAEEAEEPKRAIFLEIFTRNRVVWGLCTRGSRQVEKSNVLDSICVHGGFDTTCKFKKPFKETVIYFSQK